MNNFQTVLDLSQLIYTNVSNSSSPSHDQRTCYDCIGGGYSWNDPLDHSLSETVGHSLYPILIRPLLGLVTQPQQMIRVIPINGDRPYTTCRQSRLGGERGETGSLPKGSSLGHWMILTYSTQCSGNLGVCAMVHRG